ncbi:T9SS type A sorting domain-containing protein, partial [bacterium]|nr:T9SS type A sorting domain-containing protein [bacterium]
YNGYLAEGYHNLEIDASNLPAGVYMYQLISEGFKGTRKMVLMK